ncbi:hypothetical protein QBC38DRAFT_489055 [Podospora fimiseda]|uniref:FAD-binding PCMH-type domain-containing protein n=1 Tax=Podospora fimiseda TaxID=252190 RepID=A0AAN6YTF1_9PEZI|nr:hypothetical protein QBC38DRAFT_489055 [Podospora fimiseda]
MVFLTFQTATMVNVLVLIIFLFKFYADGDVGTSNDKKLKPRNYSGPRCKISPQDPAWPKTQEWQQLNNTLNGRLLQPTPAPSVCYPSHPNYNPASCAFLTSGAIKFSRFWLDDPLSVLYPWTEGNTCLPITVNSTNEERTCTQGGFPVYVVNATEPEHIQAAVNFARTKNIRLIIKNTGHDFLGRSNGYGSLSVWTHHMKEIQYFPDSNIDSYQGPVVKLGAGVETWEANKAMLKDNFTFVAAKLPTETVGVAGGWVLGGGHSNLASMYGLGADNVLKLDFITADGQYLTATESQNPDYFYALRGGGGSTFAIVTSVYFKAFPGLITLGTAHFSLTTGSIPPSTPPQTPTAHLSVDNFWTAVNLYLGFTQNIVNAKGFGHGDITNLGGNKSFSFSSQFLMPKMSLSQTAEFITPFFDSLQKHGINIKTPIPTVIPYAQTGLNGTNTVPGTGTFSSRLIPRSNFDNSSIFSVTTDAIRKVVESGNQLRTRAYSPSLKVVGSYAAKAVSPAMRNMILHTTVFATSDITSLPAEQFLEGLKDLDERVEILRKVTAGSGAYFNEAGRLEPNWQESFFGRGNYERLLKVKREVDPLGVFWAPRTVGSEGWEVETGDGLPTGNGRLCRVGW